MRKLLVAEHISLDGVIQAPGGPKEDPSGDFRFGGWSFPHSDAAGGAFVTEMFSKPFELLLGRHTYDIFAAYWPTIPSDSPGNGEIAAKFNATAKHVATHRPESLSWKNSFALKGDVADAVRALKKQDGPPLMVWGSSQLVRRLMAADLVDEFWLLIYPVVLGRGKRLFGEDARPAAFTLASSVTSSKGVLLARYTRAGDVPTGSYED